MRLKFISVIIAAFILLCILFYGSEKNNFVSSVLSFSDNLISNASFDVKDNEKIISESFEDNDLDNLESYVLGVVAAEMPVSFCDEALKAQAVAARTYCVKNAPDLNNINPDNIYQAYFSVDELKKRWGNNFEIYYNKIKNAVLSTKSMIMTYNGEAVTAVFHSMSSGMTEDSQNVWGSFVPYLVSKPSYIEENAPGFNTYIKMSKSEFEKKLAAYGINCTAENFAVTEKTKAGYVKSAKAGSKTVSGSKIREIFSLRSTAFDFSYSQNEVVFSVKGYGHGVGMSQYGAEFMAQNGSTFDEILKYYYTDVEITKIDL